MKRSTWCRWLAVLGLAWGGGLPAQAVPMPVLDLPAMIENADVIVAARVLTSVAGPPSHEDIPVRITLEVSRTIKGPSDTSNVPLTVDFVVTPSFDGNVFVDSFAIFFLRCGGTAACTPASTHFLSIGALPRGPSSVPRPASARARMIEEMMAILAAEDPELDGLKKVVTSNGATSASVFRSDAAGHLSKLSSTTLTATVADRLRTLGRSSMPGPRLAALAVLSEAGDRSLLKHAEADVLAPTAPTVWLVQRLVGSVRVAQGEHDDALAAVVSPWLRSRDLQVRQEAASLLRQLGTIRAVAALANFGLDDPDFDVRYYSVTGLMAAIGDPSYPSIDRYRQHERRYLGPWLAWRAAHRADIDKGTCCTRPVRARPASAVAGPPMECTMRPAGAPASSPKGVMLVERGCAPMTSP